MIPVRLAIRNFMCYRQPPELNFSAIHLACLSGDNGNGKSAIIDAMTWALWGKARARTDEDLIYSNETDMEVEFEFIVGQQVYRIVRKRARPKKAGGVSPGALELQIAAPGGFRSISDASMTQTQQRIREILRMDYETFVNSAYLKQGRADEFTRQTPAERKQVLGAILDLDYYARLEERAKEEVRRQEALKVQLESAIQDIRQELDLKPGFESTLQQSEAEIIQIKESVVAREGSLKQLQAERERLDHKKQELLDLESRREGTARNMALWQDQLGLHRGKVREYEKLIEDAAGIEAGYRRYLEARQDSDRLHQDSRRVAALDQRRHELEMAVSRAEQVLAREAAAAQARVSDLEARARHLPALRDGLEQVDREIERSLEEEKALLAKKEQSQETLRQISDLEGQRKRLELEIGEIGEKIKLLAAHTEAACPLCERELEPGGLAIIESKYNTERQAKARLLNEAQLTLARQKNGYDSARKEVAAGEAGLSHRKSALHSKKGVLTSQVAEAEKAAQDLGQAKERLDGIQSLLAGKNFAATERAELLRIAGEISVLGYSPQKHEQARQALAGLEPFQDRKTKLEEAAQNIGGEQGMIARLSDALDQAKSGLEADERRVAELRQDMVRWEALLAQIAVAEADLKTAVEQRDQVQARIWSLREKLARCTELEAKLGEKAKQAAEAARLEGIHRELVKAFGKAGVQALLIEQALPEIENEANRLLSRMTDNRMHLRFETQRQNKTGGVAETLDIVISDELGTRPYEMFSGGEAFRINFAIRIALSRLLARRAGAALPTLIIDEGFGTQDAGGIQKLKEAIISIQDDFQKIFVITHIEELREAFPTHIDVVKTPQGSTFSVN